MKCDLIVFDWDGTLMDSQARILACMEAALDDLRITSPGGAAIRNLIGLGLREAISDLLPYAEPELCGQVADRYRYHYLDASQTPSELFPGARDVLALLLERGYLLAVATGKSRRGLNQSLEVEGLRDAFHATRCADESFSKPHPEMLEQLMQELGVANGATLMVGDTEYDLQMARNAGVPSVGVCYGAHARERLLKHAPLVCIEALPDFPPWLEQHSIQPNTA